LLRRLQLSHERSNGGYTIRPPTHRFDLEIEEDLVEEIARLHGYDNIPSRPPRANLTMLAVAETKRGLAEFKRVLVAREYFEVVNLSFVDAQWERDFCGNADPIALENPIAAPLDALRSSLMGSLIANLRFNLARNLDRVRIFEAARCFLRSSGEEDPRDPARALAGYYQPLRIGGLAYGPAVAEQWGVRPSRQVDFYDVKADVETLLAPREARFARFSHPGLHPGRSCSVSFGDAQIGWLGELHPRWQQKYELPLAPVIFEMEAAALTRSDLPLYREISDFPPVVRDRSMEFDEGIPVSMIVEEMERRRPAIVRDIRVFDVYRGQGVERGKKSLAFRVVMQDTARTLTDAEADAAMAQLTELLAAKFGAKLRT
jgi:phenylalanyl-tRNA synthetase beta chain